VIEMVMVMSIAIVIVIANLIATFMANALSIF
jgi:hypothetical protein